MTHPAAIATLVLLIAPSLSAAAEPPTPATGATRTEKDLLGEKQVPADAYSGVQTARGLENFQISGILMNHYPGFVEAFAMVKVAAARANTAVGAMKPDRLAAIEKAYEAVMQGKYRDQFLVDWYQGGAGTSTNMSANEVLANIGLELSGHKKGEYQFLDPHDDLNMSQSTNDSYPTAIKVALLLRNDRLVGELQRLAASFRAKGKEYLEVTKMGRTELQDAVPMTVGQEFHAFAASLEGEIQLLRDAEKYLYAVNMGATAIGTGINVPQGYPEKVAAELAKLTNKPIVPATDMLAATWDQQGFVVYSSALKSLAVKLSKVASDLILLTSGPRAGLAEINLPALQPGSSIMPGKVNPVIPELVNLIAFRVMGNDVTIGLAAHNGQLQLNAYGRQPNLFESSHCEPVLATPRRSTTPACGAYCLIFCNSARLSNVTSGFGVLVELFQGLGRLDRIGVDDLVPDEILLLLGGKVLDVLIHEHELGQRGDVETGPRLIKRADDGRLGVGLDGEIALHLGQMPPELGVVLPDDVVVHDYQRRAVLLRERLKLFLRHVARGLSTGAATASTQGRNPKSQVPSGLELKGKFFLGSLGTLRQLRFERHTELPVLRKDFLIDETQIYQSRANGADAVLLIAAALTDDALLAGLHALALELGLTPLVEVHDEEETERALKLKDIRLIGINNRNLATFEVSLETTERLRPMISEEITVVAESGIFNAEDVQRLANVNVNAILVGEALVTAEDIPAKVRELSGMIKHNPEGMKEL